jgi:hypothetical protein
MRRASDYSASRTRMGRFETAAQGIFLEALDVAAGKLGLTVETEPLLPPLGSHADERPLVARVRIGPRGHGACSRCRALRSAASPECRTR